MAKPAPPSRPGAKPAGARPSAAAQDGGPGMDKAELKRLLKFAQDEPIPAAFALGSDGKALVVLDKRKPGRALEKQIKDAAPDSRNHRWGTAAVDQDNPKLVRFLVNKAAGGMARKLVLALKGTGYGKVEIGSEDGAPPERAEDEEAGAEQAAAAGGAAAHGSAVGDTGNRAADFQPGETPSGTGAKAVADGVAGALRRLQAVGGSVPAAALDAARRAQAALRAGDVGGARGHAAELAALASGTGAAGADGAGGPGSGRPASVGPASGTAGPGTGAVPASSAVPAGSGRDAGGAATHPAQGRAATFDKGRQAWTGTRAKLQTELDATLDEIAAHYGEGNPLVAKVRSRVEPVMQQLDDALAVKLGEMAQANGAAAHAKLAQEAEQVIGRYKAYVDGNETIAKLDANPFHPLAVRKTLDAALATLAKVVQRQ